MKKIFCLYAFDCPIIVEVTIDKKYYFDYECLHPYTNIKSTYFNENDNFLVDHHSIKIILENIFCMIDLLTKESSRVMLTGVDDSNIIDARLTSLFLALLNNELHKFDHRLLSIDIIRNLPELLRYKLNSTSKREEVCEMYRLILKSKAHTVYFFKKSKTFCEVSLPYKILEFVKFGNYHDWLRNAVTDFYFSYHETKDNPAEQRLSQFNQIDNQLKLELYLKMINEKKFTYYDDLLKIWWNQRY